LIFKTINNYYIIIRKMGSVYYDLTIEIEGKQTAYASYFNNNELSVVPVAMEDLYRQLKDDPDKLTAEVKNVGIYNNSHHYNVILVRHIEGSAVGQAFQVNRATGVVRRGVWIMDGAN
jgi:hypothetical protein